MNTQPIIGIDLGGTNIRGGVVRENHLFGIVEQRIASQGTAGEVLDQLFTLTDALVTDSIRAIGIGVPGLLDAASGMVYDVINIPSWKEIPLQKLMEDRYGLPVVVNNDANCFALGEYYFGKGKSHASLIGLTIGTGLGTGIIINHKLYTGANCGAGEFGMMDYRDHCYEYYVSGQFFQNVYGLDGEAVFKQAQAGEAKALKMYEELGHHLGHALRAILFAYDPELIIIGGSVREAFSFFSGTMWQNLQTFPYKKSVERLQIKVSELQNSGILGAAALFLDWKASDRPSDRI